jgi:hypothetical protein
VLVDAISIICGSRPTLGSLFGPAKTTPASGGHAEAVLRLSTCMKPVTRAFAAEVAAFTSEYLPAGVSQSKLLGWEFGSKPDDFPVYLLTGNC